MTALPITLWLFLGLRVRKFAWVALFLSSDLLFHPNPSLRDQF